jgi:hypothetical protein
MDTFSFKASVSKKVHQTPLFFAIAIDGAESNRCRVSGFTNPSEPWLKGNSDEGFL